MVAVIKRVGDCDQCGRNVMLTDNLCFSCTNGAPVTAVGPERYALGDWHTEEDSALAFDELVAKSQLWDRSFSEVRGYSLAPRLNRENKDHMRIDRVLIPGERLKRAGWTHVVGVELKRSGRMVDGRFEKEKLGTPLAQSIDYTQCAWNVGIYWMLCEYVFLWPFPKQSGVVESVMAQHRVGVVYESHGDLVFQLERQVIRFDRDGQLHVASPQAGRKVGSR